MSLETLTVQNLRCLRQASLELSPGRNLITGANGSGKTSLLEAISLLGRGRSFRTRNSERLVTHGESRLVVHGRTGGLNHPTIGVQVARGEATVAKIGGEFTRSLADLSQVLPVQVIEPGVHKLIEDGAFRRRRWMDWAVFHVEPGFVETWSGYTRALKQRNAALKQSPGQVGAWDAEVIRLGQLLSTSRRAMLERLQPFWKEAIAELLGRDVELGYSQGWPKDLTLKDALAACRDRDIIKGQTHAGPHRADAVVKLDGKLARDSLSRGQQKLVAVALILAQLRLLQDLLSSVPVLLLDDPAAELDGSKLTAFISQVGKLRCQLIVTSLSGDQNPFGQPDAAFHVEQGRVSPV